MAALVSSTSIGPGSAPHQSMHSTGKPSTDKPKFELVPAYIYGTGHIEGTTETEGLALLITALNKDIWGKLDEAQRKEVIETHRFVYLKMDDKHRIVEIGIQTEKCKTIEELKLSRIGVGKYLLPKDVSVVAMPQTSYANMIKRLVPQLA